jgi:hypothetical protein
MQRNLAAGACVLLGLLSLTAIAEAAGKIAGYQYYTFPNGDYPLENNTIHIIPCLPRNIDCRSIAETIATEAKKARTELDRAKLTLGQPTEAWKVFTSMNEQFLPMLISKPGHTTITTQKKGVYSFRCPTRNCLVYSTALARDRFSYWVVIYPGRKRLDLGPSKGIAADKPIRI